MRNFFAWLDKNADDPSFKRFNQLFPVFVCITLFIAFIGISYLFIEFLINPFSTEKIQIVLHPFDTFVGFFLYFVTAIDYAMIVGRMQISNPGTKARFVMNVGTCVGCFFGVSLVLFLWGFAKEIAWLIIPILFFAGSVMVKLAFQGTEYFKGRKEIPAIIRTVTVQLLDFAHYVTTIFTFWIPELASPKVKRMSMVHLASWSLFLPFIIGLDDLVGYMGAMTIYNVFSLLFGIYLADILIDILIFVSPSFTKKMVENSYLSLLAAFAFIYLAYKSYSEGLLLLHEHYHFNIWQLLAVFLALVISGAVFSILRKEPLHPVHRD
jgi:hypothetical protein